MNEQRYRNHVKTALAVTFVGIAMAMVQYKVPTVMTSIMGSFGLDASGGSWLMSIFTLMMVFSAIPFAMLAEKVGPRKVTFISVGIIIAGSIIGSIAPSGAVLLASRAVEGLAVSAMTICGPVLIESSIDPRKAGSALGIWGVWGPLGSTFAALLTPTVFSFAGMTGLWTLYTLIVAVAAVVLAIAVKPLDSPRAPASAPAASNMNASETAGEKPSCKDVFTRDTVLFFLGFAAFNICLLAVLSFVPTILQDQGMDATLSGFVSTLPMILSVVSSPAFGALSDKTGKAKELLVLAVAFLGPCALLLYTQTGAIMWAAAVVMGLIGMGSSGLMIVSFMRVLPSPRLKTIGMGVFITVQGVGQFLGTFLVQALLGPDFGQVALAGGVVCALGLVGAVCLAFARFAPVQGEAEG